MFKFVVRSNGQASFVHGLWTAPLDGWVKLNFDAAVPRNGLGGIYTIARDYLALF